MYVIRITTQIDAPAERCFDLARSESDDANPGIVVSQMPEYEQTRIPCALRGAADCFVDDGVLVSIRFWLTNRTGHSFGFIGFTGTPALREMGVDGTREATAQSLLRHGVNVLHINTRAEVSA